MRCSRFIFEPGAAAAAGLPPRLFAAALPLAGLTTRLYCTSSLLIMLLLLVLLLLVLVPMIELRTSDCCCGCCCCCGGSCCLLSRIAAASFLLPSFLFGRTRCCCCVVESAASVKGRFGCRCAFSPKIRCLGEGLGEAERKSTIRMRWDYGEQARTSGRESRQKRQQATRSVNGDIPEADGANRREHWEFLFR